MAASEKAGGMRNRCGEMVYRKKLNLYIWEVPGKESELSEVIEYVGDREMCISAGEEEREMEGIS